MKVSEKISSECLSMFFGSRPTERSHCLNVVGLLLCVCHLLGYCLLCFQMSLVCAHK